MSETKEIVRTAAPINAFQPITMAWAFPEVDPGMMPLGSRVMVQFRRIDKRVTSAGIHVVKETKEAEKWNTMVGRVVALGPLAFRDRETMAPWPEGVWVEAGDFVRVPKWGGDRWERHVPDEDEGEEPVLFATFNDHEIIARITADPLSFSVYI